MARTKKNATAENIAVEETTIEKETAKKPAEKKAAATRKAVKSVINIQYAGKSYSEDDLMQMAKDVWRYDLKQKVGDLKNVELYVKPEENLVYYVFNGEVSGNFLI